MSRPVPRLLALILIASPSLAHADSYGPFLNFRAVDRREDTTSSSRRTAARPTPVGARPSPSRSPSGVRGAPR